MRLQTRLFLLFSCLLLLMLAGMAFAVLLMNLAAPTIDYYSRPRTYGHRKAERGFKIGE